MEEKIKAVLAEIRPHLQQDGGDVKFVSFQPETGVLKIELAGACLGCPMAKTTLNQGIGRIVKEKIPSVKEIIAV